MRYEKYPELIRFLRTNTALIISTFEKSGTRNLRILKHALADFKRVYDIVMKSYPNTNNRTLQTMLIFTIAISFEINIGNIDTNFSDVVVTGFTQYGISIKDEAKSTMLSLLNNYKNIIHSRSAFGIEHLDEANKSIIDHHIKILTKGII